MRTRTIVVIVCPALIIWLFATVVRSEPPAHSAGPLGVWRLAVLDGKTPTDRRSAPHPAVCDPTLGEIPGSTTHVWNRAAWQLQLGAVRPPYVFRAYFGPSEGSPVAGDFNGDGRDELAVFIDGKWYFDFNGNDQWDVADQWIAFGGPGDRPVVGDWDQDGKFDIGVLQADAVWTAHTSGNPVSRFPFHVRLEDYLPTNRPTSSGVLICTDQACLCVPRVLERRLFGEARAVPVVGDWRQRGVSSIGTFCDGVWVLDFDDDRGPSAADLTIRLGVPGDLPIVGDFNRDGVDDLGIYRRGFWHLDTSGDRRLDDDDLSFQLGDDDDLPVVGDWDGDGRDQIGIIVRGAPQNLAAIGTTPKAPPKVLSFPSVRTGL